MTLGEIFEEIDRQARHRPEHPALVEAGGRAVTYAELVEELGGLTAGLAAAGFVQGDPVLFSIRPSIESILLILGIVRLGGVVVAADVGMGPELFRRRVAKLEPRWLMAEGLLHAIASRRRLRTAAERVGVRLPNLSGQSHLRVVLTGPWLPGDSRALRYPELTRAVGQAALPALVPRDPAFIVFTSGTTEAPRAVVHSGRSLGSALELVAQHLALTGADSVYSDQLHMAVPALMAGATAILPRRRFSGRSSLADLLSIQPSHAYFVPAQLQEVLGEAGRRGQQLPSSLRMVILASAPAPASFLHSCVSSLPNAEVYSAYALTEMLPVAWVTAAEKLAFAGEGDLLGTPCPGVEARLADDGELLLKGPGLCEGYIGDPPMLELATGDLARIDNAGRIVLIGRKKDMIIRREFNIYPALLETQIGAIPGVRRCGMVGIPDRELADERLVLVVEPDPGVGAEVLRRRVGKELALGANRIDASAQPDTVLIAAIPLAGRSRKVDRSALRALVRERLDCE